MRIPFSPVPSRSTGASALARKGLISGQRVIKLLT